MKSLNMNKVFQASDSTKIALVLKKQGFSGSFWPVVGCIG